MTKCAHLRCKCLLLASRPFGDFCCEYCLDAARLDPALCQCGHLSCPVDAPVDAPLAPVTPDDSGGEARRP
jgi:hypothetical protein